MVNVEKLKRRARKRGWSEEKLRAKVVRRERVQMITKRVGLGAVGKLLVPVADAVLSAVPFGAVVVHALDRAVGTKLQRVPVFDAIATVAEAQWDAKLQANGGNVLRALLSDAAPVWEYIEDGEYGKAVLSLLLLGGLIAAAVLM